MADDVAFDLSADEEEDDFFFMTNLHPEDTGLPRIVWVSERGFAKHDARVKVFTGASDRVRREDIAVIGVRPEPRLLHGRLPTKEFEAIAKWIRLNEQLILDHWNRKASGRQLFERLRKLEP